MESTLQKILEVLRLTPSKDKSFERDSDCNLFAGKKEFQTDDWSRKLTDQSIMAQDFNRSGNWESMKARKNGVPCKFYPRSQSLETWSNENCKDEFTDRLSIRRNSSLDSETERFCMRYDEEEKCYMGHDNSWKLPGTENLITRGKEKNREESSCGDERVIEVVSCGNQETVDAKPWYEVKIPDGYEDEDALRQENSICRSFVRLEVSSDSALHDFADHTDQLRSAGIEQRSSQNLEEVTESHIQEDIISYKRWMEKSASRSSSEDSKTEQPHLACHAKKAANKADRPRDAAQYLSTNHCIKATGEEMYDVPNIRKGSIRRNSHRLRRQERIDTTYESDMIFDRSYDTPVREICKVKAESFPSAPGDREGEPEIRQDWGGRCQIRICKTFTEADRSREEFAYCQHEKGNSEALAAKFKPADIQGDTFIVDPYSSFSMGKDLRVLQSNAPRRPMKLRRDSPFAFPLIEEFARKANTSPGSCYKKPGKNHLHANQFSGNVSCFLESQHIGEGTPLRHSAMQVNK